MPGAGDDTGAAEIARIVYPRADPRPTSMHVVGVVVVVVDIAAELIDEYTWNVSQEVEKSRQAAISDGDHVGK